LLSWTGRDGAVSIELRGLTVRRHRRTPACRNACLRGRRPQLLRCARVPRRIVR
jgi:hypothetical protein